MRDQIGKLLESLIARRLGIDLPQFGKEPSSLRGFTNGLVAAMNFQRPLRINGSQRIGFAERPAIDEAVVTRGALQINAQQRLSDTLRELNLIRLTGTHFATPLDPIDESTAGVRRRGNEFGSELIKGFIVQQRLIKPLADLFSTAGNESRSRVIISQQIIPKGQPVIGV